MDERGVSGTLLFTTEEIKLRATGDGVDGFFPKPIEWDELVDFLNILKRKEKDDVRLGYPPL